MGVDDSAKPPVHFSPTQNLEWSVGFPAGASSPCIVGERIFLTAFADGKLETLAVDRRNGRILWRRTAPNSELESFHPSEGTPASATPVSDGRRVIVYFGSYGLLAYDLEGEKLWQRPLPIPRQVGDFGSGCSPILAEGLVLLNRDQLENSELLAAHAATGEIAWRADRPEARSSFGTPAIWQHQGQPLVVLPGSVQMKAYRLKDGKEQWVVRGLPTSVCTTPVVADDLLVFAGWSPGKSDAPMPNFIAMAKENDRNNDGAVEQNEADDDFRQFFTTFDLNGDQRVTTAEVEQLTALLAKGENVALAVSAGGTGDITQSHVAWTYSRGLPYVASPLVYRNRVYFVKDGGMLTSLKLRTGEVVYAQERLGALGSYYASPIAAAGYLYCTSLNGTVTVVRAGDILEVVARNELGERTPATPAVVDHILYVRTDQHLFAFAED